MFVYWNQILYGFGNYYSGTFIETIISEHYNKRWKEKNCRKLGFTNLPLELGGLK